MGNPEVVALDEPSLDCARFKDTIPERVRDPRRYAVDPDRRAERAQGAAHGPLLRAGKRAVASTDRHPSSARPTSKRHILSGTLA
jgi:hypothetical protein